MSILQRLLQKRERGTLTVAFLGDSVTQGCFELYKDENNKICTVTDTDAAYAKRLLEALGALYPQTAFRLINAGVSGDRAPNGAKRLARDVLAHAPDLTVVCYGLNDWSDEVESVEKYCAALERIFLALRTAECEAVFLTPNCMNRYVSGEITDPDIRAVAQRKGDLQNGGHLTRHIEAALALCRQMGVSVCDCYAIWQEMQQRGTDTTALLSNRINHPTREMDYLFAYELVKTIFLA